MSYTCNGLALQKLCFHISNFSQHLNFPQGTSKPPLNLPNEGRRKRSPKLSPTSSSATGVLRVPLTLSISKKINKTKYICAPPFRGVGRHIRRARLNDADELGPEELGGGGEGGVDGGNTLREEDDVDDAEDGRTQVLGHRGRGPAQHAGKESVGNAAGKKQEVNGMATLKEMFVERKRRVTQTEIAVERSTLVLVLGRNCLLS